MYRSTEPYFTGHPFDGSLNIYYADNRCYDAETGTWLSPDPIKDGMNWYVYCGNNPVTFVDFTGLFADNYFTNLAGSDFSGKHTLYVNGQEMTVSRLQYDLRTDNDKDQITLLKEAGLISGEKEYNEQKDYYKSLTVSEIAELAGAEDTFRTWQESVCQVITVFNPTWKKQGLAVSGYGADVIMNMDVYFTGDVDATIIPGGRTFQELTIEGFKGWEGTYQAHEKNGDIYDRFGVYDEINVKVNVTIKDTPDNAVKIILWDNRNERLEDTEDGDESYGENIAHVLPRSEWNMNNSATMILFTNERRMVGVNSSSSEDKEIKYLLDDKILYSNKELLEEEFIAIGTHETAHLFGLDDAYGPDTVLITLEVPETDVMRTNGAVTSNDMEMVLEAVKLNIQQGFLKDNRSPVIRLEVD